MDIVEFNDVYDKNRKLTGKVHRRGTHWHLGEFGLVVCVWVHDGKGNLLLTRRASGKSYAGTWENTGGAVKAGESSRQAIARELFEETGIRAKDEEFELIDCNRSRNFHFDHYCLKKEIPIEQIKLLPGETDGVQWASLEKVSQMVRDGKICKIIGRQFHRQYGEILKRQSAQS